MKNILTESPETPFFFQGTISILLTLSLLIPNFCNCQAPFELYSQKKFELFTQKQLETFDFSLRNVEKQVGKLGSPGPRAVMVEVLENQYFINKFNFSIFKALTMVESAPDQLFSGLCILIFFKDSTDVIPDGYFFGKMEKGLANGYGCLFTPGKEIAGSWKAGVMVEEAKALDALETQLKSFDFYNILNYRNVSEIQSEIQMINCPRDFFNPELTNGYQVLSKITFKSDGILHWMFLFIRQTDFYKMETIDVPTGDDQTKKNYQEYRTGRIGIEIVKEHYHRFLEKSPYMGPHSIRESNIVDFLKYMLIDKLKEDNTPAIKAYQSAYIQMLERYTKDNDSQFNLNDSLAGMWYDKRTDQIFYIPSSEGGKIYWLTLNYENLFHENYPERTFEDAIYVEIHPLSTKGWEYTHSYAGIGTIHTKHEVVIITKITETDIYFADNRHWMKLNCR